MTTIKLLSVCGWACSPTSEPDNHHHIKKYCILLRASAAIKNLGTRTFRHESMKVNKKSNQEISNSERAEAQTKTDYLSKWVKKRLETVTTPMMRQAWLRVSLIRSCSNPTRLVATQNKSTWECFKLICF